MMRPGRVELFFKAKITTLLILATFSFIENNSIVEEDADDAMGSYYLGHQVFNNTEINFLDVCAGQAWLNKELLKLHSLKEKKNNNSRTRKSSGKSSRVYHHNCKYCRQRAQLSRKKNGRKRKTRVHRSARYKVANVKRGAFTWPITRDKFWISCYYGTRSRGRLHKGLDLAAVKGTPVIASASGVVEMAGNAGTFGNMVLIRHDNGYKTRYAHLQSVATIHNRRVNRGQVVGYVGNTGRVSGENGHHLHFEILSGDRPINPIRFLI